MRHGIHSLRAQPNATTTATASAVRPYWLPDALFLRLMKLSTTSFQEIIQWHLGVHALNTSPAALLSTAVHTMATICCYPSARRRRCALRLQRNVRGSRTGIIPARRRLRIIRRPHLIWRAPIRLITMYLTIIPSWRIIRIGGLWRRCVGARWNLRLAVGHVDCRDCRPSALWDNGDGHCRPALRDHCEGHCWSAHRDHRDGRH